MAGVIGSRFFIQMMVVSADSPEGHSGAGTMMRRKGQPHQTIAGCDRGQINTGGLIYRTIHPGPKRPQNDTGLILSVGTL